MKTQTLYIVPGTTEQVPFASLDRSDCEKFKSFESSRNSEIWELEARGTTQDVSNYLIPGLGYMAHTLIDDAKELGVEIVLHLELREWDSTIVITQGKSELLKAIKDAYDQGPTYATGILTKDAINFGSMLDLDIALNSALKKNKAKREAAALAGLAG